MSQLPPSTPYGNPPLGYPPPPSPGYPPQQGYGPPQRTSGTAIASLVLGILGICPVILIGGIVALILGIVGLVATGKPNVKGRGLAIAGVVLGILGIGLWSAIFAAGGYVYVTTGPDRTAAEQFVQACAAGDKTKATALCQPGSPAIAAVDPLSAQLSKFGTLKQTRAFNTQMTSVNGTRTVKITVVAEFTSAVKTIVITTAAGPSGSHQVTDAVVRQ